MRTVTWDKTCYRLDGDPVFLQSGEFHYFRVPRADWRRRLEQFKEAGGNAVATYIPWILHEPVEGDIRFGDIPERDLDAFLTLCTELDLFVTCRPGPYQYSEMKHAGLPGWLFEQYPDILARGLDGSPRNIHLSVSYLHPTFLARVETWYAAVCPLIARHCVSRGGAVAFAQFDNEVMGIHEWFGGWDYTPETMGFGREDGRYARWLAVKYGTVNRLNEAYGLSLKTFGEARPIESPPTDVASRRRLRDYRDFYFSTVAEYARTLVGWMRRDGIDCTIVHNSANPYMNSYFKELAAGMGDRFLLGSDHYYNLDMDWDQNNPTPKYASKILYSNDMLKLMGYPATAYELPGGSACDWPPITPEDARCCYYLNIALGLKGFNYYIFTGGPNPCGIGMFSDVYDFQASIGADGSIRPLYHVQKEFGRFLQQHAWLAGAERQTEFRLGLDWEHSRSKNYFVSRGEFEFSNHEAWTFWRKGMMISALCASYSPAVADLWGDSLYERLDQPLLVAASVAMAADVQRRLVGFVKRGGRLLLAPVLPYLDDEFRPCDILLRFLGAERVRACEQSSPCVNVGPIHNVLVNGGLWQSAPPPGVSPLAVEERSGAVVGWSRTFDGGGQVIFLGLQWKHAMREHAAMMQHLLGLLGASAPRIRCDHPGGVWCSLLSDSRRAMLFMMNLFSSPMTASAAAELGGGRMLETGRVILAPMEVRTFYNGPAPR